MKSKGFNLTGGLFTYGKRLIVTGPWNPDGISEIDASSVTEVVLSYSLGFCDSDVSFLSAFKNARNIQIIGTVQTGLESLASLPSLETLSILPPPNGEIDFLKIPSLRHCGVQWWNGARSILRCTSLEGLYINGIKEKDLKFLEHLSQLKKLTVSQSPISSLTGLEKLRMLTELQLVLLRTLSNFSQLSECLDLKELAVHRCNKFKDVSVLSGLSQLKRLTLDISGKLPSLSPLLSLPNLEDVTLGEYTIVEDGNMECLLKIPSLKTATFRNRKHYNLKRGEFYKRRWPDQDWTNQFD